LLALERLIELLEYAENENNNWWDELDSISEAKQLLRQATAYKPDEYEVIRLADLTDSDYPENSYELRIVYQRILSQLKTGLES